MPVFALRFNRESRACTGADTEHGLEKNMEMEAYFEEGDSVVREIVMAARRGEEHLGGCLEYR